VMVAQAARRANPFLSALILGAVLARALRDAMAARFILAAGLCAPRRRGPGQGRVGTS
jgi:hypothetical protein